MGITGTNTAHRPLSHPAAVCLAAERGSVHGDLHTPQLRPPTPGAAPASSKREATLAAPRWLPQERCYRACADPKAAGRHHGGHVSPAPWGRSMSLLPARKRQPAEVVTAVSAYRPPMSPLLWLFTPVFLLVPVITVAASTNSREQSSTVHLTGAITNEPRQLFQGTRSVAFKWPSSLDFSYAL